MTTISIHTMLLMAMMMMMMRIWLAMFIGLACHSVVSDLWDWAIRMFRREYRDHKALIARIRLFRRVKYIHIIDGDEMHAVAV